MTCWARKATSVDADQDLADVARVGRGPATEHGLAPGVRPCFPRARTQGTGIRPRRRSCSRGRSAGCSARSGCAPRARDGGSRWRARCRLPRLPRRRAGRRGGRSRVRGQPSRRSISMPSMTMSSTGRSIRPVGALAMRSTTSRPAASATSPKMVCLRLRWGVGPTVMKNCDPLVPGPGVGHREQVGAVEHELGVELVGEAVARPAGAGAERVAALDHEPADHPVERRPVVERCGGLLTCARVDPLTLALGQLGEVGDRLRRVVGEQLDLDRAGIGLQGGEQLLSHGVYLSHRGRRRPILARGAGGFTLSLLGRSRAHR